MAAANKSRGKAKRPASAKRTLAARGKPAARGAAKSAPSAAARARKPKLELIATSPGKAKPKSRRAARAGAKLHVVAEATRKPKPNPRAKAVLKKKTAATARKPAPRADYGAPIDGYFASQPPEHRVILEALRGLVEAAAPDAQSSLKWGMPFFTIGGNMLCALTGHTAHVNLVLAGPPDLFADPQGLLTGAAKTGRHLRLTSLSELPRAAVQRWLAAAAEHARHG